MKKIFSYLSLLKKYNTLKNDYDVLEKKYANAINEVVCLHNIQKGLQKEIRNLKSKNKTKSKTTKKTNEVKNERS